MSIIITTGKLNLQKYISADIEKMKMDCKYVSLWTKKYLHVIKKLFQDVIKNVWDLFHKNH